MNCVSILVLLFATSLCPPQRPAQFRVRFINAMNGNSIKDKAVNIWLGSEKLFWRNTDSKGQIVLDVSTAQPRELAVMPDLVFDCRSIKDSAIGRDLKYSLDDILSKGIVGDNLCGSIKASPTPGMLILFVRPRTSKEKREL